MQFGFSYLSQYSEFSFYGFQFYALIILYLFQLYNSSCRTFMGNRLVRSGNYCRLRMNEWLSQKYSINVKNNACPEEPVSLKELHKKTSRNPKHQVASHYSFKLLLCLMEGSRHIHPPFYHVSIHLSLTEGRKPLAFLKTLNVLDDKKCWLPKSLFILKGPYHYKCTKCAITW